MALVIILIYLLFCILVASALRKRKGGFWLFFILGVIFSPLLVAFFGLLFTSK